MLKKFFLPLSVISIGAISTVLMAREVSMFFDPSAEVSFDSLSRLAIFVTGAFALPIGQYLFSGVISQRLSNFGFENFKTKLTNYHRANVLQSSEVLSSATTEMGRAQGLFGNALAQVIAGLSILIAASAYMAATKNSVFFIVLFSIFLVVGGGLLFLKPRLQSIGISNRKNASQAVGLATALANLLDEFSASKFQIEVTRSYRIFLYGWLSAIRELWFVVAMSKYLVEMVILGLFLAFYYFFDEGDTIEAFITLFRVVPAINAMQRLATGYATNAALFGKLLGSGPPVESGNTDFRYGVDPEKVDVVSTRLRTFAASGSGVLRVSGRSGTGKSSLVRSLSFCHFENALYVSHDFNDDHTLKVLTEAYATEIEAYCVRNKPAATLLDFNFVDPSTLSTGQRQRLLFILALLSSYNIVCLDELLSGLDRDNVLVAIELLALEANERVFVIIEHSSELDDELTKHQVRTEYLNV